MKWMNYRQRKIDFDIEGYLKKNAENAQRWRDNNPEKVLLINQNKRESLTLNYKIYIRSARHKNLEFSITFEDYCAIVENPCDYCGLINEEKGFNGIDRCDRRGYVLDSCVSCCTMCNYMKGALSPRVFIKRVEHILTVSETVNGIMDSALFANHNRSSYHVYKERADRKKLEFLITEDDYFSLTSLDCYICGKKNDEDHTNGIDRIDNDGGYVVGNVACCCGECNYMKKAYGYEELYLKFNLIYNYSQRKKELEQENGNESEPDKEIDTEKGRNPGHENESNQIMMTGNSKSKLQIREEANLRKQMGREILQSKYANEEYKKINALAIAKNRAKKKVEKKEEEIN